MRVIHHTNEFQREILTLYPRIKVTAPLCWEATPTSIETHYKENTDNRPKLPDQVRNKIRLKHYSIRTEQTYVGWINRFIRFHSLRHPCHDKGKLDFHLIER